MSATSLAILLIPLLATMACKHKSSNTGDDTGLSTTDGGTTTLTGTTSTSTTTHENGCITLSSQSEGEGFAWINDAVAAAATGDTISLDACAEGTHTEDVLLDKEIHLVGRDGLILESDGGVPLSITGDGVTVVGLAVQSDDVAVSVESAASVGLTDLVVTGASWGVEAIDATGLVLDSAAISGADKGGIHIQGGSATISGGSITDSTGYGLLASDGAEATVGEVSIDSIARTSLSTDDGIGLGADGAVLHTSGNTLTNVARYGILGTSSSLDLSGDTITGAIFGVLASDSDLVASGLSVTDAWTCGIYAYSPTLAEVTDTTVVGTPGEVLDVDPSDWAKEAYDSSGIFLVAPESTVSDTSVTGYSGVGILLAAPTSGTADLARVNLTDQGHYGLYISSVQTTAEDVVVSGTYATTSDLSTLCTDVGSDVGVLVYDADLDWTGGSVSDVEGYGISNIYGTSQVDGASVSATTCGGIMAFQGDARITYSDFSAAIGGAFASSIVSYQGASLYVGGSTFHDSANEVLDHSSESKVGGVLTRRDFYVWSGSDIQVWYGADATILQNSFQHGINGVQIYSDSSYGYSSATLSDNSFSDYIGQAVYVGAGSTASITDTSFTDHGAYALACESGALDLTRVSVSTGGTTSTRTALYEDDVFVGELSTDTIGPSVFSSDCTFTVDNLTVQDADASAIYLQNGSWELSDLTISGAGLVDTGDGVTALSTSGSATLYVNGADISGVLSGSGLTLQAGTTVTTTIFDTNITDTRDDGLSLLNTSGSPGSATLSRVSVTSAGGTGLRSSQLSLSLDNLSVSSASADGVEISGGTSSLSSSSSTGNGGWGMVCQDDAIISACDITASDNTSGDFSGCGTICTGG